MDNNITIYVVTQQLTDAEQIMLAKAFSDPLIKKYLNILMFNQLQDHANIPLNTLAQDGEYITALKQAFVKGGLSILQTLNSIEAPQPTSVQANQQGQRQQT